MLGSWQSILASWSSVWFQAGIGPGVVCVSDDGGAAKVPLMAWEFLGGVVCISDARSTATHSELAHIQQPRRRFDVTRIGEGNRTVTGKHRPTIAEARLEMRDGRECGGSLWRRFGRFNCTLWY